MNQQLTRIRALMKAFAAVQTHYGWNENMEPKEYFEKMSEIFNLLARDWSIGIKEIHDAWGFFLMNDQRSKTYMEECWSNISSHLLCVTKLSAHLDFIEKQQVVFEQLAVTLYHEKLLEEEITIPSDSDFEFWIEEFVREISYKLKLSFALSSKILQAVTEAVNNAITHGNKGIPNGVVHLAASCQEDKLWISIKDQGTGFDFTNLVDPTTPENLLETNGRGLYIIKQLVHDMVFEDKGSKILMLFMI